ncbi:hypothetical protein BDD43_4706 [Mucilaginibacter gracilis]|uniref:Cytoskeletal protein CcmA (Bactofilin family) n=1 Tax=Mucilaginibacter gracilis TaxID=423350 RepID=A0A495J7S7_9SPHI|nr:hypothetical protein [Mucilaginibacter gracilis]RKR84468.1 hypothetical protein BDD43_4706 [Mucilaginibacter gracilis]
MIRASALYIVIVIALVIAVLCSSLIVAAYYYKLQYQKKFRYDELTSNLNSGINILLASDSIAYKSEKKFGLYGTDADTVILKKTNWGVFEVGFCKAFIQTDTLKKTLMIANKIDSLKWAAVYLIDEDRPLSVSGKTMIRGDAFVPKAGVKEAYVDGKAYQGDKRLVIGNKHDSERTLPELQSAKLAQIKGLKSYAYTDTSFYHRDTISNSFFNPTLIINFKKRVETIHDIKLSGNIIVLSDTTLIIEKTAMLNNVIVYAKGISVQEGFNGKCQLFASDSIGVQRDCVFAYPSCLCVLRFKSNKAVQARINLGENTIINGAVFTYEKEKSQLQTLIDIGKNVKIAGQVYAQGLVRFNNGGDIAGSVFTNRFLYQSTYTTFENYLINTRLDVKGLSPYYLSSSLFPVSGKKQKILQWLESN